MINRFFIDKVKDNFQYSFTSDQVFALEKITDFLFLPENDSIFLLTGYAGTGKSSLIGALVKTMAHFDQRTVLLAPTGRAAKVFSGYAAKSAYTIHKKIYRQEKFTEGGGAFFLSENLHKHTLFIVDEASMLSNKEQDYSIFGSGRLLNDLVDYVYSAEGCRLLLLGDAAQLPPVKQEVSPALDEYELQMFGLDIHQCELTEVIRQEQQSGILHNATQLRMALNNGMTGRLPKLEIKNFSDVKRIYGTELIEKIGEAYQKDGIENTIIISRSNKRVKLYNEGIRQSVLYREEELSSGDLLMITKNNYFWVDDYEDIDFLANGEFVEVVRARKYEEMYGFRFCEATLLHRDYDIEFEATIILDALHTEAPSLTREQNEHLFAMVNTDYEHIISKRTRYKKIKENSYFNALQVKYGYAVTCHKAQGGEWENVFLDLGYVNPAFMGDNFYRWLYTSITRSSKMLYLVNLSDDFVSLPE